MRINFPEDYDNNLSPITYILAYFSVNHFLSFGGLICDFSQIRGVSMDDLSMIVAERSHIVLLSVEVFAELDFWQWKHIDL